MIGSNTNPYQFTGRENDGTGLYFYRARYYSPIFQRFTAQDPIDFAANDCNLYAYARNAPVISQDPFGLWTVGLGGFFSYSFANGSAFTINLELVVDGQGNVGLAITSGGGRGRGAGASLGVSFTASNAQTICDLRGPFAYANAGLEGLSIGGFTESSAHGPVYGMTITGGEGVSASGSYGVIGTEVVPPVSPRSLVPSY